MDTMVRTFRTASSFIGGLVAALALAQPGPFGIQIPMGGGPMPNYWSGTNCRASGSAQIGDQIKKAELYLNGELVHYWAAPLGSELPLSMSLKVMFDSSHFPNGTPVEVKYRVEGLMTGWHELTSNPDPVVINNVMAFEHGDYELEPDAVPVIASIMEWKNYGLRLQNGGLWSALDYTIAMNGSNAVFYAGHGNPYLHTPSVGTTLMTHDWYQVEREAYMGSGLPPYNTGAPPINILCLVACHCGQSSGFKTALWPYYMAWGGSYLENQAFIGFNPLIALQQEWRLGSILWEKLSYGWSAFRACEAIDQWIQDNPNILVAWDSIDDDPRFMLPGEWRLHVGPDEGAMRLKTVYTGDTEMPPFPPPWFLPL